MAVTYKRTQLTTACKHYSVERYQTWEYVERLEISSTAYCCTRKYPKILILWKKSPTIYY